MKIPHDLIEQILGSAKAQYRSNVPAIAEAHIDAGVCGCGWLKVDANGNLTRIDPAKIIVTFMPEPKK